MSDLLRISVLGSYRAVFRASVPGTTEVDLAALDQLVATDRLVADDLTPHPDFAALIETILKRRRDGDPALAVPPPPPKPAPAGALIEV